MLTTDPNNHQNLVTLDFDAQSCFDRLELWLEEAPKEENRQDEDFLHTYAVCVARLHYTNFHNAKVLLRGGSQDLDPEVKPLNRKLLFVHALCGRVSHLSGVFRILPGYENAATASELPKDGLCTEVLHYIRIRTCASS